MSNSDGEEDDTAVCTSSTLIIRGFPSTVIIPPQLEFIEGESTIPDDGVINSANVSHIIFAPSIGFDGAEVFLSRSNVPLLSRRRAADEASNWITVISLPLLVEHDPSWVMRSPSGQGTIAPRSKASKQTTLLPAPPTERSDVSGRRRQKISFSVENAESVGTSEPPQAQEAREGLDVAPPNVAAADNAAPRAERGFTVYRWLPAGIQYLIQME